MKNVDYKLLLNWLQGQSVERPNAKDNGTLSGHAAGEPFEKLVYHHLKEMYPKNVFKQYEYLNDLYRKNPQSITCQDKMELFDSPVALFLLSRGEKATKDWNPQNIFQEKQDDTADIIFHEGNFFELIDVKTRNITKAAQAPNIISAYKVAQMCALILDNEEYNTVSLNYVEVDWEPEGENLICKNSHFGSLFKANPETLYINWAAGMQIQFHVSDLDQQFAGDVRMWAKEYIRVFVTSAKHRCDIMYKKYIVPFIKYLDE